jgi:hypothetical protein
LSEHADPVIVSEEAELMAWLGVDEKQVGIGIPLPPYYKNNFYTFEPNKNIDHY